MQQRKEKASAKQSGTGAILVLRLLKTLARLLPPLSFLEICARLGRLAGKTRDRETTIASEQLDFALPNRRTKTDEHVHPLVPEVFRHTGIVVGELLIIERFQDAVKCGQVPAPGVPAVTGEGDEIAARICAQKSGAVALSGHLGCFELLAAYHVAKGVPLTVIGRLPNYPWLSALLRRVRLNYGVETVWRSDTSAVKMLIRALRQGRFLAALIDQDSNLDNAFSPFFGEPAASPVTPLRLAIDNGLPVVTSFIVRKAPLHHHVITEEVLYDAQAPDAAQQILDTFNRRLEKLITEYPEQWLWWHRRWRRRPGEDYRQHPEQLRSTNAYLEWLGRKRNDRRADRN